MATTTNYAWETPDDTDLVKDGAAAIRTLGSSVDTTTKALNPSTTLGDIEYRSATANTNTRLGIGSTGNVLTVAGGVPTWAAPSGGSPANIAQIATGSLSGTSVSLTGLSTYGVLILKLAGIGCASSNRLNVRVNGSSSGVYDYEINNQRGSTTYGGIQENSAQFYMNDGYVQTGTDNNSIWRFDNCSSTGFTQMTMKANYTSSSTATIESSIGLFKSAAAVASLQINSDVTWTSGTYTLYGA
jgi:hypothetical protein